MGCTNSKGADTVQQGRLTSDASTPGAKAKPATTEHDGALDGAPRFTPGKLEDHYLVDYNNPLGKGHYATVYAATERLDEAHQVAVKCPSAMSPSCMCIFARHARARPHTHAPTR